MIAAMRAYNISVIAPCLNESRNVLELYQRLSKAFDSKGVSMELVLINDGSTDDTGTLIEELAKQHDNIRTAHHKKNLGIVSSWKSGLEKASGIYVCLIDADMQNLPEDALRLYQEARFSNIDFIQGWRNHVGKLKDSKLRIIASRGLSVLLNIIFSMNTRDNKSGFVVCRKEVLKDILTHRFSYHHYQTFLGVAAHYKGYSIRQIETLFQDRKIGKSFLEGRTLSSSVETLLDIAKGFVEFRLLRHYDTTLKDFLKNHAPTRKPALPSKLRRFYLGVYGLLFPIHHFNLSRRAIDYYYDLIQSQWLSKKDVIAYQERLLQKLIVHAYQHTTYWRETLQSKNIKPEDIKTIEDLQKLPIIDKDTIRNNIFLGMLSNNHDKHSLHKITTSGSTGKPLVCYSEKRALDIRWATALRSKEWTGYQFGDRNVRLWHQHIGLTKIQLLKEFLDAFLTRTKFIPQYDITDSNIEDYVRSMMKYKPSYLEGYTESFNLLARYLKNHKYSGHVPDGVITMAQTLAPTNRKVIEEAFGCGVYDKYGAREFTGGMAWQCEERNGYHVTAECNIIEIIKGDGTPAKPGETGFVILTDLCNYAMPLIRYKIGDLAVQRDDTPCPCGRGLPMIGTIEGRSKSIIIGTNKQFVPGSFFARLLADYDGIVREFQIIQKKFGSITIKIVKGNLFTQDGLEEILSISRDHLGSDISIEIEFVDEIPAGRNGKRHMSISYLDPSDISKHIT